MLCTFEITICDFKRCGAQRDGRPSETDFGARSSLPLAASRPGELETAVDSFEDRIKSVRGLGVMLDVDLAELYSVKPSVLIQAVRQASKTPPGTAQIWPVN
jgi:hypothetical protein